MPIFYIRKETTLQHVFLTNACVCLKVFAVLRSGYRKGLKNQIPTCLGVSALSPAEKKRKEAGGIHIWICVRSIIESLYQRIRNSDLFQCVHFNSSFGAGFKTDKDK